MNENRDYRPWKEVGVFLLASVAVVLCFRVFARPARVVPLPPSVGDVFRQLQKKHPEWKMQDAADASFSLRCYLLSTPYPDQKEWAPPPLLANESEEKINQYPFEGDAWKHIVFVRLYANPNSTKQGWFGHVLLKGPYLFYGDPDMLRQIDQDLP